jgi:D-glycero-alpha-D-manno-heptose 1-phosphate guanylyltransferase
MRAVILAGGLGTRLRERVADLPKVMAPVAGRPFIDYLLDWLERGGCHGVVLATGHLSEVIERHVAQRQSRLPVLCCPEDQPLGTGGAVLHALQAHLRGEPALVLNGDTWLGLDLPDFVRWCQTEPGAAAMVLRQVDDAARYGRVTLAQGRVTRFGEKSAPGAGLINAGAYWLSEHSFEGLAPQGPFSLEIDLLQPHAARLGIRGYVSEGSFIDIGVPQDFDRAQTLLPLWAASA